MITIGVLEIIDMIFSKTDMKSILFSHGDPYCLRKPVVMVNILVAPLWCFLMNYLLTIEKMYGSC